MHLNITVKMNVIIILPYNSYSDWIEFEQKFMTAVVSLAVEKLQLMHECACNHAISQFLAMK